MLPRKIKNGVRNTRAGLHRSGKLQCCKFLRIEVCGVDLAALKSRTLCICYTSCFGWRNMLGAHIKKILRFT